MVKSLDWAGGYETSLCPSVPMVEKLFSEHYSSIDLVSWTYGSVELVSFTVASMAQYTLLGSFENRWELRIVQSGLSPNNPRADSLRRNKEEMTPSFLFTIRLNSKSHHNSYSVSMLLSEA